jgi:hypothetical protein
MADEVISFKLGEVVVNLDVNEAPDLKDWGTKASHLVLDWHPRICNLLPSKGVTPPKTISLRLVKSDKDVASTTGTTISVSSDWIRKHPDDFGLIVHELVHVIQTYPDGHPQWITEGIADYIRVVVFEGQPQHSFEVPSDEQAYLQGYRIAAGFLFWLESDLAPGLVNQLNTSIRKGEYHDEVFEKAAGKSLDDLWREYAKENITKR